MPTPTYDLIASNVLSSSASSVTFSSIPATYRDLVLVIRAENSQPELSNTLIRFNSDSGSNYSVVTATGSGSSTSSRTVSTTSLYADLDVRFAPSEPCITIFQVMDYSATDKHKTALSRSNVASRGVGMYAGRWASTSAITSITATIEASAGQYASGSSFHLYGIAS
jgi:hypothetical protein